MIAKVRGATILGVEGFLIDIEVDISRGLPGFEIVGLPDVAVRESRQRVRAAMNNSGFGFPLQRLTVNLAPADLRKSGPAFDLAIALGILQPPAPEPDLLRGVLILESCPWTAASGALPACCRCSWQQRMQAYPGL